MTVRYIAIAAALFVTGCNRGAPTEHTADLTTGESSVAVNTATPVPATREENDRTAKAYAKCAAAGLTMSRIYTVLAESETGAKRDEYLDRASQRKEGAKVFYGMTKDLARKVGVSEDDVADEVGDIGRRYDRIREEQGFEPFVQAVTGDMDGCNDLMPSRS